MIGLSYILGLAVILINVMSLATSKRFLNLYFSLNIISAVFVFLFINYPKQNPYLFLITVVFLTFFAYKNRQKDLKFISNLFLAE